MTFLDDALAAAERDNGFKKRDRVTVTNDESCWYGKSGHVEEFTSIGGRIAIWVVVEIGGTYPNAPNNAKLQQLFWADDLERVET